MAQVRLADKPPYGAVRTSTKGNTARARRARRATFKINNVSPVFIEFRSGHQRDRGRARRQRALVPCDHRPRREHADLVADLITVARNRHLISLPAGQRSQPMVVDAVVIEIACGALCGRGARTQAAPLKRCRRNNDTSSPVAHGGLQHARGRKKFDVNIRRKWFHFVIAVHRPAAALSAWKTSYAPDSRKTGRGQLQDIAHETIPENTAGPENFNAPDYWDHLQPR
ncbi:hypothetical protein [Saccharopolyspora shandongensis]|uniref:hypothetical protein n=1 Tax=Saccharopolyspora shandongensis TaxID=418495 RepID=UPI0015A571F4|nr:hypothetical protein [Saccharopolyspora shandongensis]